MVGRRWDFCADPLLEICATPCSRLEARRRLAERGLSKSNSYRTIARALEEGILILKGDKLSLAEDETAERSDG